MFCEMLFSVTVGFLSQVLKSQSSLVRYDMITEIVSCIQGPLDEVMLGSSGGFFVDLAAN